MNPEQKKQQTCKKQNEPTLQNQDDLSCNMKMEDQKIYDLIINSIDQGHQQFQELIDQLLKFKNIIISSLDKIAQLILDQINSIKQSKTKMESIIKSNKNQKSIINDLQLVSNKQEQFNQDSKDLLRKQLQSVQLKFAEIDKLYPFLENKQIETTQFEDKQMLSKVQIQQTQVENLKQQKKFQYELITNSTLKQENMCLSFAFNKDNTILLIGFHKVIVVQQFKNGKILKELQRLNNHTDDVNCLYFMKQTNSFVSGGDDNQIIIWILDEQQKWFIQQVLKVSCNFTSCILMNKMEDQLITVGTCNELSFWRKETGSWVFSQSISTQYYQYDVSLNEMEDKLILCENNWVYYQDNTFTNFPKYKQSYIQVLMYQNNQQWRKVQTITIPEHGWRLSFTIGDQFVFSTENTDYLQIYDYDTDKRQFQLVSKVKVQRVEDCSGFYPCQFIKSINILIYNHGQSLNIIKVKEKNNYEIIQKIDYNWKEGRMADDGQYLVTWDYITREIQIRKIKQFY